jgi:inner membrane protein
MSDSNLSFFERANNWLKRSVTIRLITITILILLLLIPVSMVKDLIWERESRQSAAIAEVSEKWGNMQTVTGLVLSVPYKTYSKLYENDANGNQTSKFKIVETKEFAHFLPNDLNITGAVLPEVRYRGIYEVIVYNSKLNVKGQFVRPDFSEWKINEVDVLWDEAFISLGLSDLRSIQQNISLKWNDSTYFFNPGLESNDVIGNGISTRIANLMSASKNTNFDFNLDLNFNGSTSLNFIPLGKSTKVSLTSSWKTPSFEGAFLPDTRTIDEKGFTATWEVLHLNRPYPQKFKGSNENVSSSNFGVNLLLPVDEYQKTTRSAKYAVMFITLTFLVFFFAQILNRVRIHPIQYIIVGLALCVFYTLLIALSEHISFSWSYLIASVGIIGLITLYAHSIFKHKTLTRIIALILVMLYLFIYSIIQMEDYALLMGSIGLFIVLATVMYLSRKIDWYSLNTADKIES